MSSNFNSEPFPDRFRATLSVAHLRQQTHEFSLKGRLSQMGLPLKRREREEKATIYSQRKVQPFPSASGSMPAPLQPLSPFASPGDDLPSNGG